MGVNTFLLDRRTVTLRVGGTPQTIGTLRRFFKLTELNESRGTELEAAATIRPSPVAAMVMDILELPLTAVPATPVAAHMVLGWDDGRGSVTDYGWDFLPVLGYAVRNPAAHDYTLYEQRDGLLHPIDGEQARTLNLLDGQGHLIRHGQPVITACENVRPYLDRYADADCTLSSGQKETILTVTADGTLPPSEWFVGKTPAQAARYEPARPRLRRGPRRPPSPS